MKKITSNQRAFILIDSIYAVLILSVALASIIGFQAFISKKNVALLKNYTESNLKLLENIKNNASMPGTIETNSHKKYNVSLFSGNKDVALTLIGVK